MSITKERALMIAEDLAGRAITPAEFEAAWGRTMRERVPAAPLREAWLRSGLSGIELGRLAGYRCPNSVYKALGRSRMNRATALRLARALNLDPVDVGL